MTKHLHNVEDKLFEDCCKIADEHETNLLTVLDKYNDIELGYKKLNIKAPYRTIISETDEYFKKRLEDEISKYSTEDK